MIRRFRARCAAAHPTDRSLLCVEPVGHTDDHAAGYNTRGPLGSRLRWKR